MESPATLPRAEIRRERCLFANPDFTGRSLKCPGRGPIFKDTQRRFCERVIETIGGNFHSNLIGSRSTARSIEIESGRLADSLAVDRPLESGSVGQGSGWSDGDGVPGAHICLAHVESQTYISLRALLVDRHRDTTRTWLRCYPRRRWHSG